MPPSDPRPQVGGEGGGEQNHQINSHVQTTVSSSEGPTQTHLSPPAKGREPAGAMVLTRAESQAHATGQGGSMVLTLAFVDRSGRNGAERQRNDSPTRPKPMHMASRAALALLKSRLKTRGHDTAQSQGHPSRALRVGRRSTCFGRREDAHARHLAHWEHSQTPDGKTATGSLARPRPSPRPIHPRPTPAPVQRESPHNTLTHTGFKPSRMQRKGKRA